MDASTRFVAPDGANRRCHLASREETAVMLAGIRSHGTHQSNQSTRGSVSVVRPQSRDSIHSTRTTSGLVLSALVQTILLLSPSAAAAQCGATERWFLKA